MEKKRTPARRAVKARRPAPPRSWTWNARFPEKRPRVFALRNPDRLRKIHGVEAIDAGFLEKKVDRPHHDATNQKRPAHDCEAFEILTNLFLKKKRWHRRDHERNQRQAERVGQDRAIATFASRKSGKELHNPSSKINRQGQNRAELNNDGVHLPETVAQIEMAALPRCAGGPSNLRAETPSLLQQRRGERKGSNRSCKEERASSVSESFYRALTVGLRGRFNAPTLEAAF